MAVTELSRMPSLPVSYGRAIARAIPGRQSEEDRLPGTGYLFRGVTTQPRRLADYSRLCGFRLGDPLPATYPHLLAFPLVLRMMTDSEFPFPAAGLVHTANRIVQHRPISAGELLDFEVNAEGLREHPRGRQVDLVTTADVDGVEVWREVSTYLHRRRHSGGHSGDRADDRSRRQPANPPPAIARWTVTPADARAYAAISGDRNPIHTSTLAARGFGFRTRIAHGLWVKARCLAQLATRLPRAYVVEVGFQAPLPLPSTVGFSARPVNGGWEFEVHSQRSRRPHLTGTLLPEE